MPGIRRVLRFQACYYLATGAAPFISRRLFEAVTGRKTDWWLVQMVGLLAMTSGAAIGVGLRATTASPETLTMAALSAASFAAIDTVHSLRGRISKVYLCDAAIELLLLAGIAAECRGGSNSERSANDDERATQRDGERGLL